MNFPPIIWTQEKEKELFKLKNFKNIILLAGLFSTTFLTACTQPQEKPEEKTTWKPEKTTLTVSYKNKDKVSPKSFTKTKGAKLNIHIGEVLKTYEGELNYKNNSFPVYVKVIDNIPPVIEHTIEDGKVRYYAEDEIDGTIFNCFIKGDSVFAKDRSGNIAKIKTVKVETPETRKQTQNTFTQPQPVSVNAPAKTEVKMQKTVKTPAKTPKTVKTPVKKQRLNTTYYTYRKLGSAPVIDKTVFGEDARAIQQALENKSECKVASIKKAFEYSKIIYNYYGYNVPYVEKNGCVYLSFTYINKNVVDKELYNQKIDKLALSVCGNGGDLNTLCTKVCNYIRNNFVYNEFQADSSKLLETKQGNCDSISRLMVDILQRYGIQAQQYGESMHARVLVNGMYSDPTWYMQTGESQYILSKTLLTE